MDINTIERSILTNLSRTQNGIMAVPTLWSETMLDTACSYSSFKGALKSLEEKGEVVTIESERAKARITDAGKLRLAE